MLPRGVKSRRRAKGSYAFCLNQNAALAFCSRMIFSENQLFPQIKSGVGIFRIML